MKIIVPAYFAPSSPHWATVMANGTAVEYAVFNPNSGPGASPDPAYLATVRAAQAKGISMLGYVATTYTVKPLTAVAAEVAKYKDWYGIDGIFFDEVSSTPDKLPYYVSLHDNAKGIVVLNPGTYPHRAYAEACDILCVEEHASEPYAISSADENWMRGQPPEKFWYILFGITKASQMRAIVKQARSRNVGYIYITSDNLTNPFDTLPPYFAEEAKFVSPQ